MMQFSWMLLRLYGVGNFTVESEMARGDFERRVVEKAQAARSVLSRLPTWTWKCDPSGRNHRENETFIQFTEVLQVSSKVKLITAPITHRAPTTSVVLTVALTDP